MVGVQGEYIGAFFRDAWTSIGRYTVVPMNLCFDVLLYYILLYMCITLLYNYIRSCSFSSLQETVKIQMSQYWSSVLVSLVFFTVTHSKFSKAAETAPEMTCSPLAKAAGDIRLTISSDLQTVNDTEQECKYFCVLLYAYVKLTAKEASFG